MKKKSPPYAIIGAIVLGVIAAALIYSYLQGKEREKQAAIDQVNRDAQARIAEANARVAPTVTTTPTDVRPVLYATQPVEPGIRISAAFFEKKLTPKDILPDAYTEQSDIVGWYAIRKIEKGDPLTPRNIGKSLPYLSQRISPGMRSITLQVFNAPTYNLTGGFIVDGDRVDLLYTVGAGDYRLNTQLIMQNVKILYVPGPTVKTDQTDGITPVGGPIGITFEVTPEQAEALVYLSNAKDTQFSMIMRARKDDTQIKIKPFAGADYDFLNLKKVQSNVDKSVVRVNELAQQIEAKEKAESAQGKTNETPTPTPPSP